GAGGARLAGRDAVGVAWDVGRADGEPRAHCFEDCQREPLLEGRGDVEVGGRGDASRIVEPAGEDHARAEPRRCDAPAEARRLGPVADEEERDVSAIQELEGVYERVEA